MKTKEWKKYQLSISENFNDDIDFRSCSMVFESDTAWNPVSAEANESNFNPFPSKKRQLYNKRAKKTKMVKEFLSDEDFSDSDDDVTAVINALKQRGLLNRLKLKIDSQQHKCGRKPRSLEIRKSVEFLA